MQSEHGSVVECDVRDARPRPDLHTRGPCCVQQDGIEPLTRHGERVAALRIAGSDFIECSGERRAVRRDDAPAAQPGTLELQDRREQTEPLEQSRAPRTDAVAARLATRQRLALEEQHIVPRAREQHSGNGTGRTTADDDDFASFDTHSR